MKLRDIFASNEMGFSLEIDGEPVLFSVEKVTLNCNASENLRNNEKFNKIIERTSLLLKDKYRNHAAKPALFEMLKQDLLIYLEELESKS